MPPSSRGPMVQTQGASLVLIVTTMLLVAVTLLSSVSAVTVDPIFIYKRRIDQRKDNPIDFVMIPDTSDAPPVEEVVRARLWSHFGCRRKRNVSVVHFLQVYRNGYDLILVEPKGYYPPHLRFYNKDDELIYDVEDIHKLPTSTIVWWMDYFQIPKTKFHPDFQEGEPEVDGSNTECRPQ
eukprot:TRINITY_DN9587_c0_g1_i1.p1 TRINITY_DN9587_c0_g1~~TRINITY_DN9587_c0_g1_i1.p1  ORF type:complete len:180 (-),score=22.88 TRINITY_DN9587_c0_g1_i1:148-687(-)